MMFSDDILMRYADGELDEPERAQVERAERTDPAVAAAVARHRALRADVFAAFAGVLDEPVPARLQAAAAGTRAASGNVSSLDAARERKARQPAATPGAAPVPARSWPRWGALAACLVAGVLAGQAWLGGPGGGAAVAALDDSGQVLARGELSRALSDQLASTGQAGKRVQIGLSFAARDGSYCRSFTVSTSAGLACRQGDSWRIPVLRDIPANGAAYRQASSAAPAAVLDAIDERIDGVALDAAAERKARDKHWQR